MLIDSKTDPNVTVLGTYKECCEAMNKRLKCLQRLLFDFQMKKSAMIKKDGGFFNTNQKT